MLNFLIGVFVIGMVSGWIPRQVDRFLRRRGSRIPAVPFLILFSMGVALPIIGLWIGFEDQKEAAMMTLLLAAAIAYCSLPAIGLRRVEDYERSLIRKGVRTLNSEQARRRLALMLPFAINPITLLCIIYFALKRGKLAAVAYPTGQVRNMRQRNRKENEENNNWVIWAAPWKGRVRPRPWEITHPNYELFWGDKD